MVKFSYRTAKSYQEGFYEKMLAKEKRKVSLSVSAGTHSLMEG